MLLLAHSPWLRNIPTPLRKIIIVFYSFSRKIEWTARKKIYNFFINEFLFLFSLENQGYVSSPAISVASLIDTISNQQGNTKLLSSQELIDCVGTTGLLFNYLDYVKEKGGLCCNKYHDKNIYISRTTILWLQQSAPPPQSTCPCFTRKTLRTSCLRGTLSPHRENHSLFLAMIQTKSEKKTTAHSCGCCGYFY